jgi:diacylglycerol kinase (ATP)
LNKDTYIFIINPIAGPKRIDLDEKIKAFAIKNNLDFEIKKTSYKGHGSEMVIALLTEGYRNFVAVGGDGTVNEVGSQLINSEGVLSIIPMGSGNGLARSLAIPLSLNGALELLINSKKIKIDVGAINQKPFFCTAGIGFDAHCAHEFARGTHARGLMNYVKVFFKNYFTYPIQNGTLNGENLSYYSITFANAPQYGNNAYIAPNAKFDDSLLDCTIVKPHQKWYGVILGYNLFTKNIKNSDKVKCLTSDKYEVNFNKKTRIHIDGEAEKESSATYNVQVLPLALNIQVP